MSMSTITGSAPVPPPATEWTPLGKIEELFAKFPTQTSITANRPTAGPRTTAELPVGSAPFQLYSLATPNGVKVSILLEELGIDYDAHVIDITKGDQFTSGFTEINPNGKIPSGVDQDGPDGKPIRLFESGSMLLYLAEKYQRFIPKDPRLRTEVLNWMFWQVGGQGPMTGNFGHFFVYAPKDQVNAKDYGVMRYGMETLRLIDVLERHLEGRTYLVGEEYTIADIITFTWFNQLRIGYIHSSGVTAKEFLSIDRFKNVNAWADRILERPAVKRGLVVCKDKANPKPWLSADK